MWKRNILQGWGLTLQKAELTLENSSECHYFSIPLVRRSWLFYQTLHLQFKTFKSALVRCLIALLFAGLKIFTYGPTFLLTLSKNTLFILSTKSLLGKIHKIYPTFLPIFDLPPTLSYDTLPLTAYIHCETFSDLTLNWTSFMDVHLWTLIFIRISVGFFSPRCYFYS